MNILTIENDIVAKLQADITANTIVISSFPADPEDYILKRQSSILVRYGGSQYSEPTPNRARKIQQNRTVFWNITVMIINVDPLTGHQGIYTYLNQIRQSLTEYTVGTQSGSAIALSQMMRPVSDAFVSNEGALWIYEMVFNHILEEAKTT